MKEQYVLVCALASMTTCRTRDTVFGYHCSQCSAEVMVSRAGQRALRDDAGIRILCIRCSVEALLKSDRVSAVPGAMEELIEEVTRRRARHGRN